MTQHIPRHHTWKPAEIDHPPTEPARRAELARPGDRIIVETDCPYLAPVPMRGRRNEPAFLPHVLTLSGQAVPSHLQDTPVWLTPRPDQVPPGHEVLVNLGHTVPEGLSAYRRLFDIVSQSPDDRLSGRARWKTYQAMGWDVRPHEVTST